MADVKSSIEPVFDRDSLKDWLDDKPDEWAVLIAWRTALRVYPFLWPSDTAPDEQVQFTLSAFRALITAQSVLLLGSGAKVAAAKAAADANTIASAAANFPEVAAVNAAAKAAAAAANAVNTTGFAADAADASSASGIGEEAIWQSINLDMHQLIAESSLIHAPLWLDPKQLSFDPQLLTDDFQRMYPEFRPVMRWYRAILDGEDLKELIEDDQATEPLLSDSYWDGKEEEVLARIGRTFGTATVTQSVTDTTQPVLDRPTSEDLLNRRPFAQKLVQSILAAHDSAKFESDDTSQSRPASADGFAVHIHAPWGAGKSSVILMMDEAFQRINWATVHFNAWEHERRNPPWWPMIQELRTTFVRFDFSNKSFWHSVWGVLRASTSSRNKSSARTSPPWVAGWIWIQWLCRTHLLPIIVALVMVTSLLLVGWLDSSGIAAVAGFTGLFAGLFTLTRSSMFGSARNADFAMDLSVNPMQPVEKLFSRLAVADEGKPICIFIDDLDRCNPDYVVDLLEGIQTSFRHKNVVYVIAADRAWLRTAFRKRYEDFQHTVGKPGHPIGYLFLDKVFQISTPLPQMTVNARNRLWDALLSSGAPTSGKASSNNTVVRKETLEDVREQYQDGTYASYLAFQKEEEDPERRQAALQIFSESQSVEREATHALSGFKDMLPLNPRTIKRIVNAINLRQMICAIEDNLQPLDVLVRWTILEQVYPELVNALQASPEIAEKLSNDEEVEYMPAVVQQCIEISMVQRLLSPETGVGFDSTLLAAMTQSVGVD